jgi:hypothetical protein
MEVHLSHESLLSRLWRQPLLIIPKLLYYTRHHVNVYDFVEWLTTYNSHVVLENHLQLSMKIILLVLHNVTKHIAPKLFYPHELQESGKINILQIKSCAHWPIYEVLTNIYVLEICTWDWYATTLKFARIRDIS